MRRILAVTLLLSAAQTVNASLVYVESTDGELSSDSTSPTVLNFMPGANSVSGRVTNITDSGFTTADIFTFTIPTGAQLDTIVLDSFSSTSGALFMAFGAGSQFSVTPSDLNNNFTLGTSLGASTIGTTEVGLDILGDDGNNLTADLSALGSGYTVPLAPGDYTFYLQETGSFSDYGLTFNVSAVPEPGSLSLLGLVAAASLSRRRRRHS